VLETLDRIAGARAEIVGPTSTVGYTDASGSLQRVVSDFRVEYVVNGRFLDDEHGTRMLGELIRGSDGAHVWVRSYEDLADSRRIGQEIARHVARELELE
jgi:TolB-like protein